MEKMPISECSHKLMEPRDPVILCTTAIVDKCQEKL